VHLISSGQDPAPSFLLGSSSDGHDVFFGTHARLVPRDTDHSGDIYDAHICEPERGDTCIAPPVGETAQCEGDACQNPLPAPIDVTPGSSTFSGPGNVVSEVKPRVKPKKKSKHPKRRVHKAGRRGHRARHANSQRRAGR
jgi:hypothetical protein